MREWCGRLIFWRFLKLKLQETGLLQLWVFATKVTLKVWKLPGVFLLTVKLSSWHAHMVDNGCHQKSFTTWRDQFHFKRSLFMKLANLSLYRRVLILYRLTNRVDVSILLVHEPGLYQEKVSHFSIWGNLFHNPHPLKLHPSIVSFYHTTHSDECLVSIRGW